jgi:beta-barrel assembly-enhancing protease
MSLKTKSAVTFLAAILMLVLPVLADRTVFRTAWNLFTVQQDIEIGRTLAAEADSSMSPVSDEMSNTYIDALGHQLVAHAPGYKYPYQFKIVNEQTINAFALPGGFIYVTRGLVEAAPTEPQLAGAIAHEIAHVVLRHGTQQVSRAYSAQASNSTPGRVSVSAVMSDLDLNFDPNSIALKYSAEQERQADLMGAQILYDSQFDPGQMPLFFQTLQQTSGNLTTDFFNSHPTSANRVARVRREVDNMGAMPRNLRGDSPDLHTVQSHLRGESTEPVYRDRTGNAPDLPSTRMVGYSGRDFDLRYPENWRVSEDGDVVSVAPTEGMVSGDLAYGMRIATFDPQGSTLYGQTPLVGPGERSGRTTLSRATDQLLDELRRSNPNMRVVRTDDRSRRIDGQSAMAIELTNDSPAGGRESDWLVSVLRPDGLLYYFVGVAPERDFSRYKPTFDQIVASVRFNN